MPGSKLGPSPALSQLMISIAPEAKFCHLHFTKEKAMAHRNQVSCPRTAT